MPTFPPRPTRPDVIVLASLPRFCPLCRGTGALDVTPHESTTAAPVTIPCPHHGPASIPLQLRPTP